MLRTAEGKTPSNFTALLEAVEADVANALGQEVAAPSPALAPAAPRSNNAVRVSLSKLNTLLNIAGEALTARARLSFLLERFEELDGSLNTARDRLMRTATDFESRYLNPQLSNEPAPDSVGQTIEAIFSELEFDRYSDLNILARSITEMTNDLDEVRTNLSEQIQLLRVETDSLSNITRNLRDEVSRARLVSIGRFYPRLQRQVQQLGQDKHIELELIGEDVEIDSVLLDGLAEALVHLVSNAVIHGLEKPEERQAKNKKQAGYLRIQTRQQHNHLIIEIEDDGRGIDTQSLKDQALARGLISPEQLAGLSHQEAVQLMFLPGLSTASLSTEAGRGVGMDAVLNSIRRLRGEISIDTHPELGTTFTLRIPQTLLVNDLLRLQVGDQIFGIPRETLLGVNAVKAGQTSLVFDNAEVRIQPLADLLGIPRTITHEWSVVIVEGRGETVALAVDAFMGLEQSLVKPLSAPLQDLPHIVGASISATGNVILVLNPTGLLEMSLGKTFEVRIAEPTTQRLPVLLVDDSLSVRKVVAQQIRRAGYQVVTASHGQEALELLEQNSFCAVITDLEMPHLSGFELLQEVRRRPQFAHLPMAVLTTRATVKHRDLAMQLGANAYLTKPAEEAAIVQFLQTASP
jgi:chemosensory pili system protein ChpA (sensor histidine kinase/response regulator)